MFEELCGVLAKWDIGLGRGVVSDDIGTKQMKPLLFLGHLLKLEHSWKGCFGGCLEMPWPGGFCGGSSTEHSCSPPPSQHWHRLPHREAHSQVKMLEAAPPYVAR